MKRIIWEYHNGNITISVTNIDDDYMIEVFGEMGRQMCLRLHERMLSRWPMQSWMMSWV